MSKFGDTADRILEMLKNGMIKKSYLEKNLQLEDTAVIDFMEEYGFIQLNKDDVSITDSGLELLRIE